MSGPYTIHASPCGPMMVVGQPLPGLVVPPAPVCSAPVPCGQMMTCSPTIVRYPSMSQPIYVAPTCVQSIAAPIASPSYTPYNAKIRETLGTNGDVTTRAALQSEHGIEAAVEGDGRTKLTFTSKDAEFRLGYSQKDDSYSEGGLNSAKGTNAFGQQYYTTSINLKGTYEVKLEHLPSGEIKYTFLIDDSVNRLRLDIGGKSLLMDAADLRAAPSIKSPGGDLRVNPPSTDPGSDLKAPPPPDKRDR